MKPECTLSFPSQKENRPTAKEEGYKVDIQKPLLKVQSLPHNLSISSHDLLKKSSSSAMIGDNFTKSLISKIRGVARCPTKQPQLNKTVVMAPSSTSKLQKSKQNYQAIKEKFNSIQHTQGDFNFRQITCQKEEINPSIATLQGKVRELEQKNRELLEKIEGCDCEIFISRQQIEQLVYEIQSKDKTIRELEEEIQRREEYYSESQFKSRQDYAGLMQQYEQLCEEMERRQLTQVINDNSSQQFAIQHVLSENFAPSYENSALYKANCEIASLKKSISSLQKTFKASYNQLKLQKDKQISQMRRSFAKNLSHYKQIIIKFTTKTLNDTKKGRQQLHQTAITECSTEDPSQQ